MGWFATPIANKLFPNSMTVPLRRYVVTDNRQDEWNNFMQRLVPLAKDPEQVLGEPVWQDVTSGGDDLTRYWRWEDAPWTCSTFDQRDKHSRGVRWITIAHPKEQNLAIMLDEDGEVLRIILSYRRATVGRLIRVDYQNGEATRYTNKEKATGGKLPGLPVLDEIKQATPARLLAPA